MFLKRWHDNFRGCYVSNFHWTCCGWVSDDWVQLENIVLVNVLFRISCCLKSGCLQNVNIFIVNHNYINIHGITAIFAAIFIIIHIYKEITVECNSILIKRIWFQKLTNVKMMNCSIFAWKYIYPKYSAPLTKTQFTTELNFTLSNKLL